MSGRARAIIAAGLVGWLAISGMTGAAEFQNLGFERAMPEHRLPVNEFVYEPIERLLPSWSLVERDLTSGGQVAWDLIGLDLATDGGRFVTLTSRWFWYYQPLEGRFSLGFVPLDLDATGIQMEYELSQRGDVPADARSLTMLVLGNPVRVFLGDTQLSLIYDFIEYRSNSLSDEKLPLYRASADVTEFAGDEALLRITTRLERDSPFDFSAIDATTFSTEAIPDPGSAPLVLLLRRAGANVELQFLGPPGSAIAIETSTNLSNWTPLASVSADSQGFARYTDSNVVNSLPQRFYRASR